MSEEAPKTYLALPPPAVPAVYKQPDAPNAEQMAMYDQVLEHFSQTEYVLPGVEQDGHLVDREKLWLRLEDTLKWRREFGVYDTLSAELVEPEAVTGKEILFGYDKERRPGFYMIPSRQNTDEATRQVQFAVWMLERAVDLMGPGVEKMDLLIDFAEKAKNPSIGTARTVLNILQSHYPERLGLALILNIPWLITMFLKAMMPFVDPVTRLKIKLNPKVSVSLLRVHTDAERFRYVQVIEENIFEPEMIFAKSWGGAVDFEYEHDKYWPSLVGMCDARRAEQMQRWKELGATIGAKEWEIK
ncbi:hypothetical protein HWV62_44860, partial [Athelia sp. TMB]